ncbi:MAG TPA: hypothetical protein VLB09_09125, partial [Nitrospiria bacterium]|nr:hypothetical protein [Nitrospiria bacterium]
MTRDQVFLEVASNLVKFYSMMGHALRFITGDEVSDQMPLEELLGHLKETREALDPHLAGNPVVKGKVENDYRKTLELLEGLNGPDKDESKKEEAHRLL